MFKDFQSQALRTVSLAITDKHILCYFFWSFFWGIYASFLYTKIVLRCTIWLFTVKINMPAFTCFYLIASAFPLITSKFSAYKKLWLNIPSYCPHVIRYVANPCHNPFPQVSNILSMPSIADSGFSFIVRKPLFSSFLDSFSASCRCFLRCLDQHAELSQCKFLHSHSGMILLSILHPPSSFPNKFWDSTCFSNAPRVYPRRKQSLIFW